MSQLLTVRDAICAKVRALVPGKLDVAGHFGRFSDEELRKFMASAPAVRVALLALENPQNVDELATDYRARFGLYVVTRDGAVAGGRDEQAVALVEAIVQLCRGQRWGVGSVCLPAESASASNLYNASALADGVALWAIDLRQPVRLQPEEEAAAALTAMFGSFVPDVGLAHIDDYVQLAPESA